MLHYFLQWVESPLRSRHRHRGDGNATYADADDNATNWVDRHVHAIVSIATPFLGVPKSIPSILSGEMRDTGRFTRVAVARVGRCSGRDLFWCASLSNQQQ